MASRPSPKSKATPKPSRKRPTTRAGRARIALETWETKAGSYRAVLASDGSERYFRSGKRVSRKVFENSRKQLRSNPSYTIHTARLSVLKDQPLYSDYMIYKKGKPYAGKKIREYLNLRPGTKLTEAQEKAVGSLVRGERQFFGAAASIPGLNQLSDEKAREVWEKIMLMRKQGIDFGEILHRLNFYKKGKPNPNYKPDEEEEQEEEEEPETEQGDSRRCDATAREGLRCKNVGIKMVGKMWLCYSHLPKKKGGTLDVGKATIRKARPKTRKKKKAK